MRGAMMNPSSGTTDAFSMSPNIGPPSVSRAKSYLQSNLSRLQLCPHVDMASIPYFYAGFIFPTRQQRYNWKSSLPHFREHSELSPASLGQSTSRQLQSSSRHHSMSCITFAKSLRR
jgi:hypothetical protein